MAGLALIVPGSLWALPSWASGDALTRRNFVGAADAAFWFDPSDISTLFQDRAGTVPVTEAGQDVAYIRDKSGLGMNAILRAEAPATPTYETDGGLHWINIPLGGYFELANPLAFRDRTMVAGVRFTGGYNTDRYVFDQNGISGRSHVVLNLGRKSGVVASNIIDDTTTGNTWELNGETTIADGTDVVLGMRLNLAEQESEIYLNGALEGTNTTFTEYVFGTNPVATRIFSNGTNAAVTTSGRFYFGAWVKAWRDIAPVTAIAAAKTGVALS